MHKQSDWKIWLMIAAGIAISTHAVAASPSSPDQFLKDAFGGQPPKAEVLWLTQEISATATRILGHAPNQLRQRYWHDDKRSVWILDEIGKEEPITAGFIIENGRIKQVQVLAYRESRGGEIKYAAFLDQYEGISLNSQYQLDHSIDGISGATLSVRAMERMARLALYFSNLKK